MNTQKAIHCDDHGDNARNGFLNSIKQTLASLVTTSSAQTVDNNEYLQVKIKSNGVTLDLDSLLNNSAVTRQVSK
ncbi:hypothetical protein NQT74_08455 [Alteromonas stellipolaris]|uniref:hypothetical protein n=1 Tax=Alteromonas stellipolaris TaxID=233316 RepID=UPI0021175D2E|nr:hypothetical protein [Alteromonas stellipolaris]MCQ8848607.1 hypothetical protein [Alteromonas stellipolaris]